MPYPAGQADYPGPEALSLFLTEAGLRLTPGVDLVTAAAAGVREFETRAARTMLAQAATYSYDMPTGPSGKLVLRRDLLAVSSLAVVGIPRVLNTDYWLYPEDAGQDGRPYGSVELLGAPYYPWGYGQQRRRAVAITGTWGYGSVIPEDAYRAMILFGALGLTEQLRGAALWSPVISTRHEGTGGMDEKHPGTGTSETFNAGLWDPLRAGWEKEANLTAGLYKRTAGYLTR